MTRYAITIIVETAEPLHDVHTAIAHAINEQTPAIADRIIRFAVTDLDHAPELLTILDRKTLL